MPPNVAARIEIAMRELDDNKLLPLFWIVI